LAFVRSTFDLKRVPTLIKSATLVFFKCSLSTGTKRYLGIHLAVMTIK